MGEIGKAKIAAINAVGEDALFERMARGETVSTIIGELDVGWKLWHKWLDAERGRKDRYRAAQEAAGHFFASRAVDTAQKADPATVNVSRLQVDTDKWIASKLNQQYDVRQKDIAINISVNDLHAQAAELLGDLDDVEDAEIVEEDGD
jgi:hypothetical protein